MRYRTLGRSGLHLSEVGFGTWGLGGEAYGPTDDDTSQAALLRALDLGINFFETGDLYGAGHSEKLIGRTFRGQRSKIVVATNGGTLPHDTFYTMPQDFSPSYLRKALIGSLRRLETDYIDLYQLHSPPLDLKNWPEVLDTLQTLKQEGLIREFGVTARTPVDAKILIEKFAIPVVQVNLNMIDQRTYECGLLDLARERGCGVIARTPLCYGFLTGKLTDNETFGAKDHRAKWPREQLKLWARAPKLFTHLNVGKDRSLAQLALQYCIADCGIACVIPGMMTSKEVEENVKICSIPELTTAELESIREIYKGNIFYDPKAKISK